ncbi:MAG: HlyC/CorC family transporter [Desulfobulbaceae bacterium]|nr:MAG: HlyC/CorC family transporter [Desulfobulbaceae bacterium]
MENSQEDEPPSVQSENNSLFRRLRDLIPFGKAPDTTEALEHEIQELLEEGEEQGLITSLEERMINSIFDFRDTVAAEIMTPAVEIISFDVEAPVNEIVDAVIDEGLTRIPIYQGNTDRIVGIIHAKDLLKLCARSNMVTSGLGAHLNKAYFISEDKPIGDLLREFQKNKTHMAIVADEFGAVRGLITLEDILEEIVGEIDDEYDVEDDDFEMLDNNTWVVRAKVDIEDVEERLSIELPEGPYESVGGLIIHSLGRLGVEGDNVSLDNATLTVHAAGKRRIKKVKIVVAPGEAQGS